MKTKIFLGILALAVGFNLTSCDDDDDDFSISTSAVLSSSSVVTGSADVTSTTADLHATVNGNLGSQSTSAYTIGFEYGLAEDALTETASGTYDSGALSASLSGLTNATTYYYRAYVCLQSKVYYRGEIKSFVTTDAKSITGEARSIDYCSAVLAGSQTDAPSDATVGFVISTKSETEDVRAGLILPYDELADSYSLTEEGLMSNTTYYYASYIDLGSGVVYGDVKSFTTSDVTTNVDDDFVDLGLSVKWAKKNVGAKTESSLGGLFGFGDLGGVNPSIETSEYASADTYKTSSDVAYLATGGIGTLPTASDFEELYSSTTHTWTEQDGVKGLLFTASNGNTLFLPAAGSRSAQTTSEEGTKGLYATGTVNASNTSYAVSYQFTEGIANRTTTPVYQALSVRPVSTARNVPFVKEYLYNTWEIDLTLDGSYETFPGPVYFYGIDDSWATVTNNEPAVNMESWSWQPDFAGNSWVIGGDAQAAQGSMTFASDGTYSVTYYTVANGVYTANEATGTYTVDEENKTITLEGADLLCTANYYADGLIDNKRTDLKILSLTESSLQIAPVRTDPTQDLVLLSMNYVTSLYKYGYTATLVSCDSNWNWQDGDSQASAKTKVYAGDNAVGQYELSIYTTQANGMIFYIDIANFATDYPNAIVVVDDILLDGTSVAYDQNKFYFGDIEGKGNYRIELANTYGSTAYDSPFTNGTTFPDGAGESALAYDESVTVKFSVLSLNSLTYTPQLATINSSWGGPWDCGTETFTVSLDETTHQYDISKTDFSITYTPDGVDHTGGSIMTFISTSDLFGNFPGAHMSLDALYLDGTEVTGYDESLIANSNDGTSHRLELWNMYGVTKDNGCAFGTADSNGVISELGFSKSMQIDFTVDYLFSVLE